MDRAEFWLEGGLIARAARDGNPDRVLDTARPRREHDDAVREPQGLVEIVRDVNDRELGAVEQPHQVLDQELAGLRIERRERLVHQQQGRTHRERAGNADALAHAAGELLRERLGEFREPVRSRASAMSARRSEAANLRCSSGNATLSAALRQGSRAKSWKTNVIGLRLCGGRSPKSATLPLAGSMSPPTIDSSVLLPQPDGPTMASTSPDATANDTSSRTRKDPKAWLTCSTINSIGDASNGACHRPACPGDPVSSERQ